MSITREPGSFRDSDGFVFHAGGELYRTIGPAYRSTWEKLQSAGFFTTFLKENKLPAFSLTDAISVPDSLVIKPQVIPFISYSCEWSFAQLKKAALLTLELQEDAMKSGFTLKDASAFNVQFNGNQPVFIDLLSFEEYDEGAPWIAYGQFCRHFLAPMLLDRHGMGTVRRKMQVAPDGIPLGECSRLLPFSTRLNFSNAIHIHLHAKLEKSKPVATPSKKLKTTKARTLALVTQLADVVRGMKLPSNADQWSDYYQTFSYDDKDFAAKKKFVAEDLSGKNYLLCVDLGANTGEFSKIAAEHCQLVVACDSSSASVEKLAAENHRAILPLHVDLLNPTPSFGWDGKERQSFVARIGKADVTLALALIHHLCVGANVPLEMIAAFFAGCAKRLMIEFVPPDDPMVQRLLYSRKKLPHPYSESVFREAFELHFDTEKEIRLESGRILFSMKRKQW